MKHFSTRSKMKNSSSYQKFTYWLPENSFLELKTALEREKNSLFETKKAVCLPLSPRMQIGYAAPGAWSAYEVCRRQLSWYGYSRFDGQYLVVSNKDLSDYGLRPETVIHRVKFKPPKLPGIGKGNRARLIKQAAYQEAAPAEWNAIETESPGIREKWLKNIGVRRLSFQEIFITHCANHANFIAPHYAVEESGRTIPYAIDKTRHLCSACLEFYNIIGSAFEIKRVVPCPGAAMFAGLAANQYYEVRSGDAINA